MASSMQQILPIVWNTLTESAALYPFQGCGGHAGLRGCGALKALALVLAGIFPLVSTVPRRRYVKQIPGSVSLPFIILT